MQTIYIRLELTALITNVFQGLQLYRLVKLLWAGTEVRVRVLSN